MGDEQRFKYLVSSKQDSLWGITVDNVGSAEIPPGYKCYPPQCGHPHDYFFRPDKGRMLDNYQFIYISHGRGTCNFHPNTSIEVNAGDMLIIPPFTWHSYWPDRKTGWHEHWIGMRGSAIENRFRNGFVSPSQRIFKIGYNEEIIEYYRRASAIADLEMPGYQQVLAGLANLIFSLALYQDTNQMFANDRNIELIEQARTILRENYLTDITPQEVAKLINMSYSLFRKVFKEYNNISPTQYVIELKLQNARKLLMNTDKSIKEIAFYLNYDDPLYFSSLFKKHVGYSPSTFREKYGRKNILKKEEADN